MIGLIIPVGVTGSSVIWTEAIRYLVVVQVNGVTEAEGAGNDVRGVGLSTGSDERGRVDSSVDGLADEGPVVVRGLRVLDGWDKVRSVKLRTAL